MRASDHYTWNDQSVQRLKDLWESGASCQAIADAMGISKNALVGKAHRLGLPGRASPIKRTGAEAKPRVSRRVTPPLPALVSVQVPEASPPVAAAHPVPAVVPPRAIRSCCWPTFGNAPEARRKPTFCEKPTRNPASPYCQEHSARAYVGPREQDQAA